MSRKTDALPLKPAAPAWQRCEVNKTEAMAIRAMHANNASPEQQRTFMLWLNNKASPAVGLGWDPESARLSDFQAGRRFVALKIIEVLNTNPEFYTQGANANG